MDNTYKNIEIPDFVMEQLPDDPIEQLLFFDLTVPDIIHAATSGVPHVAKLHGHSYMVDKRDGVYWLTIAGTDGSRRTAEQRAYETLQALLDAAAEMSQYLPEADWFPL